MRLIDAVALEELIDTRGASLGLTIANRCNFKDIIKLIPTVDCFDRLVKERDAAVAAAENISSDFSDYVCSGVDSAALYCGNRCAECVDRRGDCRDLSKFCKGFVSKEYTEWRGVTE